MTGTDDPALLRTIREALADPGGEYAPRLRAIVPGPALHYDSAGAGSVRAAGFVAISNTRHITLATKTTVLGDMCLGGVGYAP